MLLPFQSPVNQRGGGGEGGGAAAAAAAATFPLPVEG